MNTKKITVVFGVCLLAALQGAAYPVSAQQRRVSQHVQRRVLTAAQRNRLATKAASNPHALGQLRRLLNHGANPCRALPFAVFAGNVRGVEILSEYKDRCNWKVAVEERLPYVVKNDLTDLFYALMADNRGITCPDPFDFTPAQRGAQWHPLSAGMLAAVNQRCFATRTNKSAFLKEMILLNPGQKHVFTLGETYKYGIHSQDTQNQWLSNINQLVSSNVKVSNDTLQSVIAQSRVTNYEGVSNLPFETTRKLVKLCLKGGADGKAVLAELDQDHNAWVWEHYSADERMRLSNLLEHKPEQAARTFVDTLRKAYHKIF